ncbi:unnamed protein product [Adineta steineri]|uniref:MRH domain-containing protein n=1 Tax=Adineta steineri TaxID=433720 RepID=A0A813U8L2_9BILA|nr:unnamed protein product [Adineta steineri]CAF4096740.1 unnamed protein product [Adineta steineri]
MFWLKSFTSLLAVLTTLIIADDPCRFEHSKGVIDLRSLARTDGKAAYPDKTESAGANYLYSYNPCKPFSEEGNCIDVAVCQISRDKENVFSLGEQESAIWNPGEGPDDSPSITYRSGIREASVTLICATDETNKLEVLGEDPEDYYKFRLTNKCACWNGCDGTPPQRNCTIDGSTYTSDKQIIRSLPFTVLINPPQPQPSPPTFSYANVDRNSHVFELILVNIPNIPLALFCLSNLQELSIFNSPNVVIPPEISRLYFSLTSLIVSNISQSGSLPVELFNMELLSTLSIINGGLEVLSEDVSKLISLTQLTLDKNRLVSLPWALGNLSSLTSLSVNDNLHLSSLDVLRGSTSLNILRASNCMINHLPANIPNLHIIELDGNQLTSLDGLDTTASHTSTSFSFNNNKIVSISSVSLARMEILNYFYLSNNLLTTLPDSLYLIKDMKKLDIQNNNFDAKEKAWIEGIFRVTNTTVLV